MESLKPRLFLLAVQLKTRVNHRPRGTGASVDAANHVGQQLRVEVKKMPFGDARRTIAVAPTR
jgi:hypothetical protein